VSEVGGGFVEAGDGEALGGGARAETLNLEEDEPHPVGALLAGKEFGPGGRVGGLLGFEEAVEVVGGGGWWHGFLLGVCQREE
jgi:hypothetical protein